MPDVSSRRSNALGGLAPIALDVGSAKMSALPDAAKLIFQGRASAIETLSAAFGIVVPQNACRFVSHGGCTIYWLGPSEWMLQSTAEDSDRLFARLERALNGQPHSLVDVSHRSDAFALSGAKCAYLLNHGCPLDLSQRAFPVGMCTRTIFGRATILLSRAETETFHIDVWRSFAPYVWHMLAEARSELA